MSSLRQEFGTAAGTAPVYRHPLGLPAGSVRAGLAVMIVGLFWLLQLSRDEQMPIPLYLYFLLGLVFVFFSAHGHSIGPGGTGQPSPWWLPRGTIRWLILLGFLGVNGWLLYSEPDQVWGSVDDFARHFQAMGKRMTPQPNQLEQWPYLFSALAGGYALGWLFRLGPWNRAYWFQDIQAWISLLAMLGLGAEILIRLFINPTLELPLNLPVWESILVAIISFYFGVRS
jgi:hypothetical protein